MHSEICKCSAASEMYFKGANFSGSPFINFFWHRLLFSKLPTYCHFFAYYTYKPFWEGLTELNYTNTQFIIGAAKVVHKIVARRCFRHHPWLHRMALYLVLAFGDTILPVYLTLPALLTARYGSLVIHTYKNQWLELASTNSACKLAMELCIVEYSWYWIYTASCFLFITRQLIVLCECMLRRSYEGVECWISVKDSSITWYK